MVEGVFSTGKYISVDRSAWYISTVFGSCPPLVRVFQSACERQADAFLRCRHSCTSSVVSHRLYRVRSTRTVSCPLRISIAGLLDQAGALSYHSLPVRDLCQGVLLGVPCGSDGFQKRDNSLGLRKGFLFGRRRRQGVLYDGGVVAFSVLYKPTT